jgi:hypothetical protein
MEKTISQTLSDTALHLSSLLDSTEAMVNARLAAITEKDSRPYAQQRRAYNVNIFGAMNGYLTHGDSLVSARNEFSKEMIERFYEVFKIGFTSGGADESELEGDSDDLAWINARTEEEIGYIKSLFVALKEAKGSDLTKPELIQLAHDHADAYTNSLDMVYSEGKMRGGRTVMLTMVGEDGNESCDDCRKRKGKRYSAKKWLAIGYPPSRDFECHGYNCQHYLVDDSGKRWTQ